MTRHPVLRRMDLALAAFLASCGGPLDDVACLSLEVGGTCPDEEAAREELVGDETCETPVRKVVRTGAFVSEQEVVYTGYGGTRDPETAPDTATVSLECCYEAAYVTKNGQSCTPGRPLTDGPSTVTAAGLGRAGWCAGTLPDTSGLDAAERAIAAEVWLEQALAEHASVASFSRLVGELLEVGAPASLVDRAGAALRDEIRHAEQCFAVASAYAGRELGPSGLRVPRRRGRVTLARLAVEAWREGCVGETLAVGLCAAQLSGATDPAVRAVVEGILADEAEHAAFAWDLAAWALAAGGAPVERALRRAAGTTAPTPVTGRGTARLVGHGLPSDGRVAEAMDRWWRGVVVPSRDALLAA